MRVLHIVNSISRDAGGPSRSVQGLVAGLNRVGIEAILMTLKIGEEPWVEGVTHFINGGLIEKVLAKVNPHIVHLHGIWSLELHRCAVICRRLKIPYVVAPRGMLEPWSLKQKWLKKRIARWLYQDRDLKYAAALHATAGSEAERFRELGFKNSIIVSPNGVNVPKFSLAIKKTDGTRRILFVSRMHPKKGVLELIEAWGKLVASSQSPDVRDWKCELVYTVSGEFEQKYEEKAKARVNELGMQDQFVFTGALNDDEKWKAYARADLFVLPTYSENFGIVVVEALCAGVPVITTKGTPWHDLEGHKCGWWIDLPVEGSNPSDWIALNLALNDAVTMSDKERIDMGVRGRKLVEEKYTWDAVVKSMVAGYSGVLQCRLTSNT